MSIEAMKQALDAMLNFETVIVNSTSVHKLHGEDVFGNEILALGQAIEQAEKQEPVAYMDDKGYICNHTTNPERWTPLYTAPPQREWVGLTEEEWTYIWREADTDMSMQYGREDAERMIEAKLKEKNHVS